jgi:rod shape-determining protein MreD
MMPSGDTTGRLSIAISFLVAFVLSILPVPAWAQPYRPDWVALVLIYWCVFVPGRVGVGTGWLAGLVLDVLYGSLLGNHALAKSVVAYVSHRLHLQLRVFPRWQQAIAVLALVALNNLVLLWVRSLAGAGSVKWSYWTSSVVSMLVWPWLFIILRDVSRRARLL